METEPFDFSDRLVILIHEANRRSETHPVRILARDEDEADLIRGWVSDKVKVEVGSAKGDSSERPGDPNVIEVANFVPEPPPQTMYPSKMSPGPETARILLALSTAGYKIGETSFNLTASRLDRGRINFYVAEFENAHNPRFLSAGSAPDRVFHFEASWAGLRSAQVSVRIAAAEVRDIVAIEARLVRGLEALAIVPEAKA